MYSYKILERVMFEKGVTILQALSHLIVYTLSLKWIYAFLTGHESMVVKDDIRELAGI